jgi:peptidoglycan-associated lipoprotein
MKMIAKRLSLFLTLSLMIAFVTACGSQKTSSESSDSTIDEVMSNEGADLELNGTSDAATAGALVSVQFPFDSSRLTSITKKKLKLNAEFLKAAEGVEIQIEGHCDERGGIQYNIALGERRARAVKDYLSALGVSATRMTTISYGKERPVAYGHDEEAWAKNRRANFVVTVK